MRINQRGPFGVNATSQTVYCADRWIAYVSSQTMAINVGLTSSATILQKAGLSSIFSIGVSASLTGGGCAIYTVIEGYNIADFNWGTSYGVPVTLSFYASVTTGANIPITIKNANSTYTYVTTLTTTAAATWQYYSCTIPAPPTGSVWNTTNGIGLNIMIAGVNGVLATASTGWLAGNFYGNTNCFLAANAYVLFTGMQLEKGTMATPFEFLPITTQLQLCQRYFNTSYPFNSVVPSGASYTGVTIYTASSGWVVSPIKFEPEMRVAPTMKYYSSYAGTLNQYTLGGSTESASQTVSSIGITSRYTCANLSNVSAGNYAYFHWTADAEF